MNTESISFQKVLDTLVSDRKDFPRRYLQEFSDIGTLELKTLLDVWPRVELSRKLSLLEDLIVLADSDTLVSFDDFARALPYFEKAAEMDPNYPEAWYQAGFSYGVLGRHNDALSASKKAARLRPDWAATHVNIGASSFALGQFAEAEEAYYRQRAALAKAA